MSETNGVNNVTLEDLRTVFHQPRETAAESLGLTVNELKKVLKLLGVARWPYRKLASLQSLHQDLEQQLQQFTSSPDPSLASHVKDLQEMQARIAEDSAKIMQDPNHTLDEGLHKLRLQNYKARFMGKHGLITSPPILKMPAAPDASAQEAAAEAAAAAAAAAEAEPQEGEVGWTGRRRRAASIAASNSIKRAAGLVSSDLDEDELPTPSLSRSKTTGRASITTSSSRPPVASSSGRGPPGYMGPATLAALPCLPEYGAFHEDAVAQARMAQSAPLFDAAKGGALGSGMPGHQFSMSSLNQGVAGMSLEQQRYASAMGHMPGGTQTPTTTASTASLQYLAQAHPVPSHLLPAPGGHHPPSAWPRFASVPVLNQHSAGGSYQQPGSEHNSSSFPAAPPGAPPAGAPYRHADIKSEPWADHRQHGFAPGHHVHSKPRHMAVVEPLVTPLEALLDEMVGGSGAAPGDTGLMHQTGGVPSSHQFGPGFNLAHSQALSQQQHSSQRQPAQLPVMAQPGAPAGASGVLGPASDKSFDEVMRQRRVPNTSMFLLNSDEEDDALITALLTSPANDPRSTRYLGGAAQSMTQSAMDSRAQQPPQHHVGPAPPALPHSQPYPPHAYDHMRGGASAPMMSYGLQQERISMPTGPVITTGPYGSTTTTHLDASGPSLHTISSSPRPRAHLSPMPYPMTTTPHASASQPLDSSGAPHRGPYGQMQDAAMHAAGGYHAALQAPQPPYPYMTTSAAGQRPPDGHQHMQQQQAASQQQHHQQQPQQQPDLSDILAAQQYDDGGGTGAMDIDLLELDRMWKQS